MARENADIMQFAGGEMSASALARVDQARLRIGCEIQENLFPHVIGKGLFRPGTTYVGTTNSNQKTRPIPFIKSTTDAAIIELSTGLMRIRVSDALVTRPSVTSTVTNGDFSSGTGWTLTASDGATSAVSGGFLALAATARGSTATALQAVTTSSTGTEHALRIVVSLGPVLFRVGSTSGGTEYVAETSLGRGTHSIAFTPSASPYYIQFSTRSQVVASIDQCTVESAGTLTITGPWTESDLPLIRYAQSLDVVFIGCESWQQMRIERRHSGRSWSLVYYEANDGPFITSDTGGVTLTASTVQGAGTMTASAPVFSSTDVGRLITILPSGYTASFQVAGSDQYSGAVRVYGVNLDTNITYAVAGTFVGTWNLQRSYDDEDRGFIDVDSHTGTGTISTNYSSSLISGQPYNNIAHWFRLGFKASAYTSGTATFTITYNGGGRTGIYRITGYTSSTLVSVQPLDAPGSLAATTEWSLGAWSSSTQWPSAVAFFDGRIWWGGDDEFWSSESDSYYAFNLDDEGSSGSIQRVVATGGQNEIRWMLPLQRMILGTSSATVSIRSSSFDEPLTPVNITLKECSTNGVAKLSPAKIDNRGYYIHSDGRRLFELTYDGDGADYRSDSLMTLNESIGGSGLMGIAAQRSPETYLWIPRADGQVLVLLRDVREKVLAWVRFIAASSIAGSAVVEDVCVLPSSSYDRVYLYVRRTINGSVVRYVEKLALHSEATGSSTTILSDSSVFSAGPVTTLSGLSHLVGETVVAWGTIDGVTGPIGTTFTVNGSGQITLPGAATNVSAGLAYSWRYKSAKLAYAAKGGTPLLQPKRVGTIGIVAENIHPNAMTYGPDFSTQYSMPRIENGQAVGAAAVATYDEAMFAFGGGWDTDSRVCLMGSSPYPVTLNALVVGIETNEV